jgi:hypothetical protein
VTPVQANKAGMNKVDEQEAEKRGAYSDLGQWKCTPMQLGTWIWLSEFGQRGTSKVTARSN